MSGLLTGETACALIARGLSEAAGQGQAVAIAVVDAGGHLLAFQRHVDTMFSANEAAVAKARTAAGFRRATAEMQSRLEQGRTAYLSLPGCLPLAGGVPVVIDGHVRGGLGVSGAPSERDAAIAQFAVAELAAAGVSQTAIPATQSPERTDDADE